MKKATRVQVLLGCLVILIVPAQATIGSEPTAKKRELVLYGVERQGRRDNEYDSDWLRMLRFRKLNPFSYANKEEMVQAVLARTRKGTCVKELYLYGHGTSGFFCLGLGQQMRLVRSTYVSYDDRDQFNDWKGPLEPLKKCFCEEEPRLTLMGCNVGSFEEGSTLLFKLAKFLDIKVRAPVNQVRSGFDYKGRWQEANPSMQRSPSAMTASDRSEH